MDLREAKKIKGFKKKCEYCGKEFIAHRKTAQYCLACQKGIKWMRDNHRNYKKKQEKILNKIPKELKEMDMYDKFIEDIADRVISKMFKKGF